MLLALPSFPDGIHSGFGQEQRLAIGQIQEALEVIVELARVVDVDVEAMEINLSGLEIFSSRVVGESAKKLRIKAFYLMNQLVDEFAQRPGSGPADEVRRKLVGDAQRENRGVARANPGRGMDAPQGILAGFPVFKEIEMLVPGDIDQQKEAGFLCFIQNPLRWRMIDPDDIGIERTQVPEILFHLLGRGEKNTLGPGLKRSISEPFYKKGPSTAPEQTSIYADSMVQKAHLGHIPTPLRMEPQSATHLF